jgi:tripartite-type tricarboxylate transporter receptor subunit TctC
MNKALLLKFAFMVLLGSCQVSRAQTNNSFPNRPIKLVVGFTAGASSDVVARLVAQKLSESLGQPISVDNKPGAGSSIGADFVAKAAPDGYTLLLATVANAINASLMPNLSFDMSKDFASIGLVASVPNLLVIHPSVPARSVKELIIMGRQSPDRLMFASSGNGTGSHLAAELFKSMADIKMTHVPYRGSPQAVTDLISGRVSILFSPTSSVLSHIKSGALVGLASTGTHRTSAAPELPTVAESGLPGYETSVWFGLMAPKGTPKDVVDRLNRELIKLNMDEKFKQQLTTQGIDAKFSSPDQMAEYMQTEMVKWSQVIKTAGVKVD